MAAVVITYNRVILDVIGMSETGKMENEKGSIVLEASYCIFLSVILFMFVLSFGIFLYQKVMFGIVANEVAEEVASTYKLRYVADSSQVTMEEICDVGKYRFLFFSDRFLASNEAKASWLASVRLSGFSLAQKQGAISADIVQVADDIGRRHYEVTVRQAYSFLMGDLLGLIGLDRVQCFEKTVCVEGVDILNYVNTVKTTKYGIDKVKDNSAILGLIDSVIGLLHSIFDD